MSIRTRNIDTRGRLWTYRPTSHKTEHFGRGRVVYLGPQAPVVLAPFLKPAEPDVFVFSPKEAVAEMRQSRRLARKTRPTPSELAKRRRHIATQRLADRYNRRTYGVAIARGCQRAFPAPEGLSEGDRRRWMQEHRWSPNRLRHNAATSLRKQFGIEAARVVLGHTSPATTEI